MLAITFSYLYFKLFTNETLSLAEFTTNLVNVRSLSATSVLLFLILSAANWIFEILKWQTLVSSVKKINFNTALKPTLGALTVSSATPNHIGDYGAKAYFYPKEKRWKFLVPMLFFFDVVVRGGVAVWLFSYLQVPELIVLSTGLAMWLLNFVIPSIIEGFYVLTYQPYDQ